MTKQVYFSKQFHILLPLGLRCLDPTGQKIIIAHKCVHSLKKINFILNQTFEHFIIFNKKINNHKRYIIYYLISKSTILKVPNQKGMAVAVKVK